MKPSWLSKDTLDDRRELFTLLSKLSPLRRVAFLAWCCAHTRLLGPHPHVRTDTYDRMQQALSDSSADEQLIREIILDYHGLCANWDLDPDEALQRLVEMVRGS